MKNILIQLESFAGSQREESHPWQGHVQRPDGQGESSLRVSPWYFLSIYLQNKNLPALVYCTFPLFWHTLEKVNSGLQSPAKECLGLKPPLITL